MINSVNFKSELTTSPQSNVSNNCRTKAYNNKNFDNQMPFKGYFEEDYEDDKASHPIRDLFLTITSSALGLVGFNAGLCWLQNVVNGKLLVGKINKHFTGNLSEKDNNDITKLAGQMQNSINTKPEMKILYGTSGEAYYTHELNQVHISPDQKSSLFHEFGHAWEENNTKLLKFLQRRRGNFTVLSLALYALMSLKRKPEADEHKGFFKRILNPTVLVPLAAFSPELVTEAVASLKGVHFLSSKVGKGISKNAFKNIEMSYLTCFGTYLFVPISIIIMDYLQQSGARAEARLKAKIRNRHQQQYMI